MNLMTRGDQTRYQLLSDRSRRTSHQHSHQWLLDRGIIYTLYDETAAPAVTPPNTPAQEAATSRFVALWVRPAGARLRRAARGQELPVIDRPHKHWHCWPHLKPVLATRGLHLPTDAIPPANGPDPSWWGDMPAQTWFGGYLHDNLMDPDHDLASRRYPDYPEPVIDRRANYWY